VPYQASDSDNESVLGAPDFASPLVSETPGGGESNVSSPDSRKKPAGKRRARLSMDERVLGQGTDFASAISDDTRRSLGDDSRAMRHSLDDAGARGLTDLPSPPPQDPIGGMPAITPFSFRFLPKGQDVSMEAAKEKSVTFRFDGARLSLPGLVLSERGMSVGDVPFPEELDNAESFKLGTVRIAELGRGASGVVYSALILSTFRIVAVKEVRFGDRSARHQVVRELKALSRTQNPYIVKMLGAHLDPSSECVAMVLEYINGGSLQDFINVARGEKIMAERMLVNIAHDVTCALAYCHDMGMAHLDVKPSNILLSLDGTAKVADFGLARQIDLNKMAATFVGTTKYLSPERLRCVVFRFFFLFVDYVPKKINPCILSRGGEYSFPADIWGLGMCLLAAALGKYPFDDLVGAGTKNEQVG